MLAVDSVTLPFTKRTLANGLDVIVHEDHHVPIVAVNIWYHVGSKDERPGRTGFAHLFEHLMFEGSEHHDAGFFPPLQQAGGVLNGSTNTDRTNYWEVVPTSAIDLALWMESDRMGYLLPAVTRERFETQRDVVLNERRQELREPTLRLRVDGDDGRPVSGGSPVPLAYDRVRRRHPRHAAGRRAGVFRTYYHASNASLTLAGDIETERAFDLAERYFGELPPGQRPLPARGTADLAGEVRLVLEDRVEMPRVYMAWLSPAMFDTGDAELDLLGDLLANGKTSRLYRTLVYERRVALDVSAYQSSRELAGFFVLVATAAPGGSLTDIAAIIDAELQRLTETGPSESEMERARTQAEAHFMYRLQTVGGFGGKSDQLNAYNVLRGDPGFFPADLSRYREATTGSVRDAAARFLAFDRRVMLSVVPRGLGELALSGAKPVSVS